MLDVEGGKKAFGREQAEVLVGSKEREQKPVLDGFKWTATLVGWVSREEPLFPKEGGRGHGSIGLLLIRPKPSGWCTKTA